MDKENRFKLKKALENIVYDAEAVLREPKESHHRLETIVATAQKQLKMLKEEEKGLRSS